MTKPKHSTLDAASPSSYIVSSTSGLLNTTVLHIIPNTLFALEHTNAQCADAFKSLVILTPSRDPSPHSPRPRSPHSSHSSHPAMVRLVPILVIISGVRLCDLEPEQECSEHADCIRYVLKNNKKDRTELTPNALNL